MNIKEFYMKYCSGPNEMMDCHQFTWDLIESIGEKLENEDIDFETRVGAVSYEIDVVLEICREDIADHQFLEKIKEEIKNLREK